MRISNFTLALCIFTVLATLTPAARADADISWYENTKRANPDIARLYLTGLSEGILWTNAALEIRLQPRLFCPPKTLSLNSENFSALLDSEFASNDRPLKSTAIGLVLLKGLMKAFPCLP